VSHRLARIGGVYPIGQKTATVAIAGRTWELWAGYNGKMRVFSFIAPTPVNTFSADVKQFFDYLQKNQNYPASSQNLIGELDSFI
jgi:xyloglucan-specific endo-beta-1,4-glucanase